MKRILSFFLLFSFSINVFTEEEKAPCEPKEEEIVDTKTIQLNFLDQVVFKVPGCVIVKQGVKNEYRIVGDQVALNQIKVSSTSGDLTIEPKGLQIGPRKMHPVTLYVTAKDLQKVTLRGNANCDLRGIKVDKLTIDSEGNATIKGNVTLRELVSNVNGNGVINLKGSVREQHISLYGNATFDGSKLSSNSIVIDVKGDAKASLKVSQKLIVSISGDGSVTYVGNPKTLKHTIRGNGSLRRVSN